MPKKLTTEEFIEKAKQVHKDAYNYNKVKYVNAKTKVCIICPIHGEFWQTPDKHLAGHKCPFCNIKQKLTIEEFIKKANIVHNDFYNYSKVKYLNKDTKVCIICPIHGEFWQTPHNHITGKNGCPICRYIKSGKNQMISINEFIKKAKQIHKNKFIYDYAVYKGYEKPLKIICPILGEFWQTPSSHLQGHGCPKCNQSHLEKEVMQFLEDNNIKYEYQRKFKWLGQQSLDFYLPDYNIAIECQGKQHFIPTNFGSKTTKSEDCYNVIINRDKRKLKICKENNVKILYYTKEKYDYFLNEKIINNKSSLLQRIFTI